MKSKNKVVDILNRAWKSLLLPAIVFLAFTLILGEDFLNSRLLLTIARQTAMPILLAFSMALMMFMGMMNFAMGAVLYTAVILGAYVAQSLGGGIPLIFVFTVIFAIIFMAINGWLYNLLKVPCIVLSLGLALVIEALGRMLVPSGVAEIGGREGYLAQSPYCFVILLIGFIIFYVVFNYTTFGHNVRAIGESQQVATQAGINVARTKFIAFVLSGLFVGMASMLFLSSSLLEKAQADLIAGGYSADTPAAIVYKATWPDEQVFRCTVGTLAETAKEHHITKTALITVGGFLGSAYDRSLLYDPGFSHGCREASR